MGATNMTRRHRQPTIGTAELMTVAHITTDTGDGRAATSGAMLHLLLVEDVESDALLIEFELRNGDIPFMLNRVETEEDFIKAIKKFSFDAVLSDYHLPSFSALQALRIVKEMNLDIPFILVTGSQSEEIAVDCIKQGADDYLLKQSLTRLPSSLLNAINKKQIERERQKAIAELKTSRENLRALSAHLQSIREEERTRIAREIHDELGQMLTALKMDVLWLHGKISGLPIRPVKQFDETIRSMTFLIDSTINSVRRIATDLRPGVLDDLGLVPAIEWQSQEFEKRTGIQTKFSSSAREANIEREHSTAIFRILQEALTNVVRHSKATKLYIRFEMTPTQMILTVEDNGRGIRSDEINSPKSLGLLGMRERAELQGGSIDIVGQPDEGTVINVTLPRTKGEKQKQRHD